MMRKLHFAIPKLLFLGSLLIIFNAAITNKPEATPSATAMKAPRRRKKRSAPRPHRIRLDPPTLPPFNAATLLGAAYPWRCLRSKRKRNPPHYCLIMKVFRRTSGSLTKATTRFRRRKARKKKKQRDTSNDVPTHWKHPSEEEILEDYERNKSKVLHKTFIQYDAQYGVNLDEFVKGIDPLRQYKLMSILSDPSGLQTVTEKKKIEKALTRAKYNATTLSRAVNAAMTSADCGVPQYQIPLIGRRQSVYLSADSNVPMVIDTGASVLITPNRSDFIGEVRPSKLTSINGLTGEEAVVGSGKVAWTVRDLYGTVRTIKTTAYLVPSAQIRLFSPQSYFKERQGGSLFCDHCKTVLTLKDKSVLEFPYQANNIPVMLDAQAHVAGLSFEDIGHLSNLDVTFMSVAHENNQNLTSAEKEKLTYHFKLGHAHFQWVNRLLAQPRNQEEKPILPSQHKGASTNSRRILCAACEVGKQSRRTPDAHHEFDEGEMAIRQGDLQPGDKVSIDSYISSVLGRLPTTKGKEKDKNKYTGGTIFCDHASGVIFVVNQVSLRAGETLVAKHRFEQWAHDHNVPKIKSYRADHVPFNSENWQRDLALKGQTIDFSGVGAHHQNAVAERSIQTVTKWARTMLLHLVLHWPEEADVHLWPFALEHAAYIWNHLPRRDSKLAPLEIFAQSRFPNYSALQRLHVFGCPTYVLDPKLQDGKKIPKWKPRARRGMYLGYLPDHSSTVARILNLNTKYVSPQYHYVCDDHFSTVPNNFSERQFSREIQHWVLISKRYA